MKSLYVQLNHSLNIFRDIEIWTYRKSINKLNMNSYELLLALDLLIPDYPLFSAFYFILQNNFKLLRF